jgi:hypothetical protein
MKPNTNLELHKYSSPASGFRSVAPPINVLRVHLPDGTIRDLTHPLLSPDFVSGVMEDSMTRAFFRKSSIKTVEFFYDDQKDLPELRFTKKTLGEQLLEIQLPARSRLRYSNPATPLQFVEVVGLYGGFLVTGPSKNVAIPISALAQIEIDCE